ncbi:hypothetical protein KC361_g267 [Hortaea werneckii]|nr:hypothetical protein KC361_g267 [Hortaea werneckii]
MTKWIRNLARAQSAFAARLAHGHCRYPAWDGGRLSQVFGLLVAHMRVRLVPSPLRLMASEAMQPKSTHVLLCRTGILGWLATHALVEARRQVLSGVHLFEAYQVLGSNGFLAFAMLLLGFRHAHWAVTRRCERLAAWRDGCSFGNQKLLSETALYSHTMQPQQLVPRRTTVCNKSLTSVSKLRKVAFHVASAKPAQKHYVPKTLLLESFLPMTRSRIGNTSSHENGVLRDPFDMPQTHHSYSSSSSQLSSTFSLPSSTQVSSAASSLSQSPASRKRHCRRALSVDPRSA